MSSPLVSSSASAPILQHAALPLEDLFCPIAFGTMRKVETLCCGHSFEKSKIQQWLRNHQICPTCNAAASILPTDEEIQKMVANASKRTSMQAACNQHHLENGSANEVIEAEEPVIQEAALVEEPLIQGAPNPPYLYELKISLRNRTPVRDRADIYTFSLSSHDGEFRNIKRAAVVVGLVAIPIILAGVVYLLS